MRRWWPVVVVSAVAVVVAAARLDWFQGSQAGPNPLPVPDGDQEIAWLHNPTSFESWENFVWGLKRAETAADGPEGLVVDDSAAYPDRTTAVPEIVVRRKGFAGNLRVRWYKVTDEATQEGWVNALAARGTPPVAVTGGWSSDRAKELAYAMRDAKWNGPKPLLFLTQATADRVYLTDDHDSGPSLIEVYDRSFRFCFTNKQMVDAVTDFVLSDPTLRPGPIEYPGLRSLAAAAAGPWAALTAYAAEAHRTAEPLPAFAIAWKDDDYSTDLSSQFRKQLADRSASADGLPLLKVSPWFIPFSVGRFNRPNRAEAETAEQILKNLPPPGYRTVLVIPTVSAPARRTLRSLVQGNPTVGQQLVAVTGDGIGVNTFFRDREFAWPVRSLPIPVVLFLHADPFGWDKPGAGRAPPAGYELPEPAPGAVRSSVEDIQLFSRLARVVAAAAFPDGTAEIIRTPDALGERLRNLTPKFFDAAGNRKKETGEHVVVLRPTVNGNGPPERGPVDAVLEVYTRPAGGQTWSRIHSRPLGRADGGRGE
jgi:hypothetical protein